MHLFKIFIKLLIYSGGGGVIQKFFLKYLATKWEFKQNHIYMYNFLKWKIESAPEKKIQ